MVRVSPRKSNNPYASGTSISEKARSEVEAAYAIDNAKTDPTKWRMLNIDGKQTWEYLEDASKAAKWPQTMADKWYLGLPTVSK
jgi:hypothetical protein